VEQFSDRILYWEKTKNIPITHAQADRFSSYVEMVFEENMVTNITGFASREAILDKLVLESLNTMSTLGVPRGTTLIDVGSGAGIPGIPTAILFPDSRCVLLEVNLKKATFLNNVKWQLGLTNVEIIVDRAESAARAENLRESFDLAVCRAVGGIYMVAEFLLPFVRVGGRAFMFTNKLLSELNSREITHIDELGGQAANLTATNSEEFVHGIILEKNAPTGEKYPRRFAVIKREAARCENGI